MLWNIRFHLQTQRLSQSKHVIKNAFEHLSKVKLGLRQLEPTGVGAREQQQILHNRTDTMNAMQQRFGARLSTFATVGIGEYFFNAGAQNSNRRLQMVRSVGGETDGLLEAALQPLEGRVQHLD